MNLSKYKITVSALGYDDYSTTVAATSKQAAGNYRADIVERWLEVNAIDADSKGLASVKIQLVK